MTRYEQEFAALVRTTRNIEVSALVHAEGGDLYASHFCRNIIRELVLYCHIAY